MAIERARKGEGPMLIEAKTYRIKGHFVGDPEMYRTKAEVQEQFDKNDPIKRFIKAVNEREWLNAATLDAIKAEMASEIERAVEAARRAPYPESDELFSGLYVEGGVN